MIRHCVALGLAGLAVFSGAATAHAQTADERFVDVVTELGVSAASESEITELGRRVCTMLTEGFASNVNPVPVVRGVVTSLQSSNLNREQAVGFMRASVAVYCPNHARLIGR
ncbi:DUF732 domain-containing protein [Mycobacterium sp. IDR2000157661]|uniref:DUF732 domain-containing protein n=1 Tax=Mycobacterium sp. IDR2000157661 TaxID=2867005 RepID=UPI001EEA8B39|nr:DUF732 domain-containing protein [Mycobacterium sp. IDR2000157661]ULE33856.1 DUF732 domain-containing protein [Mycobacterium sp. IDR2000157661]